MSNTNIVDLHVTVITLGDKINPLIGTNLDILLANFDYNIILQYKQPKWNQTHIAISKFYPHPYKTPEIDNRCHISIYSKYIYHKYTIYHCK